LVVLGCLGGGLLPCFVLAVEASPNVPDAEPSPSERPIVSFGFEERKRGGGDLEQFVGAIRLDDRIEVREFDSSAELNSFLRSRNRIHEHLSGAVAVAIRSQYRTELAHDLVGLRM
jgi:hypothetical protein